MAHRVALCCILTITLLNSRNKALSKKIFLLCHSWRLTMTTTPKTKETRSPPEKWKLDQNSNQSMKYLSSNLNTRKHMTHKNQKRKSQLKFCKKKNNFCIYFFFRINSCVYCRCLHRFHSWAVFKVLTNVHVPYFVGFQTFISHAVPQNWNIRLSYHFCSSSFNLLSKQYGTTLTIHSYKL